MDIENKLHILRQNIIEKIIDLLDEKSDIILENVTHWSIFDDSESVNIKLNKSGIYFGDDPCNLSDFCTDDLVYILTEISNINGKND